MTVKVGKHLIGPGNPVFIIAEIGINHNGSLDIAKKLIDCAKNAGCSAVKFQKRTPEVCVPDDQKNILRETPWGLITYLEYKKKIEFGQEEFREIDSYCRTKDILWLASSWDSESLEFVEKFNPPCHKIPSALLTDHDLLKKFAATRKPIILSTGMSTMEEITSSVGLFSRDSLLLAHATSIYPCPLDKLNLKMIPALRDKFNVVVGYSGHEVGLSPSYAAVALGASFVERHITLDRAMWGTDQSASVEPGGIHRLVENIRDIESSLGDGIKKVFPEEAKAMAKLRKKGSS